ncbi:ABC transporter permease [Spirosoma sp. KUDC1026]|uniref:ABC transporter permease n=1 Tax=Spirosoma sp. KUDC1026 TaxID=2745947 RepID=UPI00159BE78F|nr:FtsX-like permease family protein [Spirosoma sp. KUDC1026]QKZ11148.1 ABC transporter permease [Spirosoma sp. KUDC1026]
MFGHLTRLMWNQKGAHTLLIIEILASFLVLFGLASLIIFNVKNYVEPLGFSYEQVWAITLNNNQDTTDVPQKIQTVMQRIRTYPEVESISRMSSNFPFSASQMNSNVSHDKASVMTDLYNTDEGFAKTIDIALVDGHWYRSADSIGKQRPVVINQPAREALFGDENPLGKKLGDDWKVVGVIGNFKSKGEFMSNRPAMFELIKANNSWDNQILVKVKPGTDALFEARLVRDIALTVKGWSVEVDYLVNSRQNQRNVTLVPIIIAGIVCGFLLINVALGLFGVLNVSIAKRRGEIGLRRALGATEGGISWQFVGEIWVLATFALIVGLLLAGQFPLLKVFDLDPAVYLTAMLVATLIVYLLVSLCALYPSRQAATVQPAVALHEE